MGARGPRLLAFGVCCALLLPAWVVDFRDSNGRAHGPTWKSQLVVAVAACRVEPRTDLVTVRTDPPGWTTLVPCGEITGPHTRRARTAHGARQARTAGQAQIAHAARRVDR
jgi:hypothetical protein